MAVKPVWTIVVHKRKRKFDIHACEAGMNIKFPALRHQAAYVKYQKAKKLSTEETDNEKTCFGDAD
jgi:hypothetical protein